MPACLVILDPIDFHMKTLTMLIRSTKLACSDNEKRMLSAWEWGRVATLSAALGELHWHLVVILPLLVTNPLHL